MRKTGSREPLESREASVVSPCSIAVNTFSIRLGSRRNQRPVHQKIRSITTVSPMMDTIKIGHMIGPPLWNLSINQLLPKRPVSAAGEAAGGAALAAAAAAGLSAPACAGLNVAVTGAPGAAGCPAAPGCPGAAGCCAAGCCPGAAGCCAAGCPGAAGCCAAACPGGTFVAGACAAAAGFAGAWAAGFVPAAGGACLGGGDCASEISANASKDSQVASSVFIIEEGV